MMLVKKTCLYRATVFLGLLLIFVVVAPKNLHASGCYPPSFDLDAAHGIAAIDSASGTGWIMWSSEAVHQRFSPAPHRNQAKNLIAVRYIDSRWVYDNNRDLVQFTPRQDDCLIAEVDFTNDTISKIGVGSGAINGISAGIQDGILSFSPNRWNGAANRGEFEVSVPCLAGPPVGDLGYGVAARDSASGLGWILWSSQAVHQRFGNTPHPDQATNLIAVTYVDGQWFYDNNKILSPFTPRQDDCLIAEIDFTNDSIGELSASSNDIHGINSGIREGLISFAANIWNGSTNSGEFGLTLNHAEQNLLSLDSFTMVFNDEFNGNELDPTKWDTSLLWGPYYPINNEEQLYVDTLGMHSGFEYSPFELTGSTLKITATPTSSLVQPPPRPPEDSPVWRPRSYSEYRYNGPTEDGPGYRPSDVNYLSGIITSYESFKMTHGYVEMRAKLPAGRGLWPAFWMLTTHYVEDVPEIDVMEFLGQDVDRIYHTYHYFDIEDNWQKISTPSFTTQASDWTKSFHTFGMAWSPTEIIWYVDGKETRRITRKEYTIPNQAMYILANLAVGGNWAGAPDANTAFPATFEIDYVRASKRKLNPKLNITADYQLMFVDNFNGTKLNPAKWNTHFLWGPYLTINNEEQYYVDALGSDSANTTASNTPFVVNNGVLSITARQAEDPNSFAIPAELPGINDSIWTDYPAFQRNTNYIPGNFTSGIITSYDAFKFAHGYAEIRAKVPAGGGLWPAFWLLNGYYVNIQPEIDVMEMRGEFPTQVVHSYHRLVNGVMTSGVGATTNTPSIDYSQNYHTYGVRWQPGRLDWYIDRKIVHTYKGDDVGYQTMYVLANLAVGGDFSNGTPVDVSRFNDVTPVSLDIDYIKVYQERHKDRQ